ncbi:hypothetical protein LEP1GSC041_0214 [Leptospira noguchii str. 2006001870]|nr:hypothetical protein LEP1GSC041_0214 [Leptospira noguchii str. 2006001870]
MRVPTNSKSHRKIQIRESSHKFKSLTQKSKFVRVPTNSKSYRKI